MLYRITAASYEYCPTVTLQHTQKFSNEELDVMFEQATVRVIREMWPQKKKDFKEYIESQWERVPHMGIEYPRETLDEWPQHFLEIEKEGPHETVEYIFDDVIDNLCKVDGFQKIEYIADIDCGAWDTIKGVTKCAKCGTGKLVGKKFHGEPLKHTCVK